MKRLLLMRHGKSSWRDKTLADFDRPLKRRGERAALQMGKFLQSQSCVPSLIISSSAERAQATARLVLNELPEQTELELCDDLYHALPKTILRVIHETNNRHDALMMVGHNPGLQELVYQWSAEEVDFTTAAVAHFEFPVDRWSELKLNLNQPFTHFWKPKELDREATDAPNQNESSP